jgi:hypothetical protein
MIGPHRLERGMPDLDPVQDERITGHSKRIIGSMQHLAEAISGSVAVAGKTRE